MKHIPFHKAYIGKEEIKVVVDVLKSGWHTMGPKTVEFEERFKAYTGARFAIAVNSCTAALHLALEAIGLKEGDEVIVPAITFTASAEVVCYFKAKPVFVDVERDTMNMDTARIEALITKKTRAIITVDFAGQPVDYTAVCRIAKKHKLLVIEDAAHTLPSSYKGRNVGTLADITCFSFYATKTLNTGEGGMITTDNEEWASRMKTMRLHGMNKDAWKRYSKEGSWFYEVVAPGFKYNTTDINAALGLVQLDRLAWTGGKRKAVAAYYDKAFKAVPEIDTLVVRPDRETSWHLYVIKLAVESLTIDRSRFITELAERGISASVHFIPLYRHPFYRDRFKPRGKDFHNSEWLYERILSLPIYPGLTQQQLRHITKTVKDIIAGNRK
ncbi:MAG: DegT/DnrJ/EryC1/StrS family aminotransferase [Candidatus Omnitrophota bacterium]